MITGSGPVHKTKVCWPWQLKDKFNMLCKEHVDCLGLVVYLYLNTMLIKLLLEFPYLPVGCSVLYVSFIIVDYSTCYVSRSVQERFQGKNLNLIIFTL